ncbi:hypothetical protein BD410DRAFT_831193 [Rickenella mellea]|uniref:F-box domain-containing protein n=1 Tax=Rickenella mellea TaxID=50990 RepID=A0A4Y7PTR6_9AGAM|nr:hypothetical protein BD410DRAFT_831193 [Rickenella mellea]
MDPCFLPPEIWRNIFRFATFTATSLNVMDWDRSRRNAALSYQSTLPTKKALTLVSRKFREMSLDYVFELVQIFNRHNAQRLLDTIREHTTYSSTGSSPAKLIKYIIVVPGAEEDSDLSLNEVWMKIFPFCTKLAGFATGWKSAERGPNGEKIDLSALMASIPSSITTLEWHRTLSPRSFHSLRKHAALRNLRVSNLLPMSPEDHDVIIPFITHLDVCIPMRNVPVSWWDLPSVSHLTLEWPERRHYKRLIGKSKDTIRSLYLAEPCRSKSNDFPWIVAKMPNLETFCYDIVLAGNEPTTFPSSWLGVGYHASLTHIYLFCRGGGWDPAKRSFSEVRDSFSRHLQPLMTGHLTPLTVSIIDTHVVFGQGDFHEDGYEYASKQRFFDDLSASLSSPDVQCIVK